jgi:hypothetical protein
MSESSFPFGAVAVAEPPLQPGSLDEPTSDRRRLMLFGGLAALVLAGVAAYFLLFSGGGSTDQGFVAPTHHAAVAPVAPGASTTKVVPPAYNAVTGRDPFKPLYVAPAAAPPSAAPAPSAPIAPAPATQPSGSSTGTTTTAAKPASPVWVELDSQNGSRTATLRVAYSDATTRVFQNVPAPKAGQRTVFAKYFALLAVHSGYVTVQYGDGKPFDLRQGFASRHFV